MDKPLPKILDCSCGRPAEIWVYEEWSFTGCRECGKAAATHKNIRRSVIDWNNIQKFVPKNLTAEGSTCKIGLNKSRI